MSIKSMPANSKPREKAMLYGLSSLSDSELLALIVQEGIHNKDAIQLSYELINKHDGLYGLSQSGIDEFKIKGIGKAKALKIMAAFELGKRALNQSKFQDSLTEDESFIYKFTCDIAYQNNEYIKLVMLDKNRRLIKDEIIAKGREDNAEVEVRAIMNAAAKNMCKYIYVFHNHPSGDSKPSKADLMATQILDTSLSIMGVKLVDHIIVSGNNYYSMQRKVKRTLLVR
ncbi:MAG: DNA repair protein RadC [Bacilli bacterium]